MLDRENKWIKTNKIDNYTVRLCHSSLTETVGLVVVCSITLLYVRRKRFVTFFCSRDQLKCRLTVYRHLRL